MNIQPPGGIVPTHEDTWRIWYDKHPDLAKQYTFEDTVFYLVFLTKQNNEIYLPDVRSLDITEAENILDKFNLKIYCGFFFNHDSIYRKKKSYFNYSFFFYNRFTNTFKRRVYCNFSIKCCLSNCFF